MILEGIVTTLAPDGAINIAPMGPIVDAAMQRLVPRPFRTAQTYRNLKAHGEGVLHVTDDVLLLARSALGPVEPPPDLFRAEKVRGWVLGDACRYYEFRVRSLDDREERTRIGGGAGRYYEFRVRSLDDREERTRIEADVVHAGRLRDFFGFNRAKHAVVEAAILATRAALRPAAELEAEYRRLAVLVEKTGGPQEREAFAFLRDYVARAAAGGP